MFDMKHVDEYIVKAVKWGAAAGEEINKAGGYGVGVLKQFSNESITTMVRNDLAIVYKGKP